MAIIAVFGDVHANRLALEQIITSAKQGGATTLVLNGDIVGYGPNPKECIELVQNIFTRNVKGSYIQVPNRYALLGNHGRMLFTGEMPEYVDGLAKRSMEWTWEQTGKPVVPGEADRILKTIHRGVKRPRRTWYQRWYQRISDWWHGRTSNYISDWWHGRTSNYIYPEEWVEIEKNMDSETREKLQKARELKAKEDRFKPYYDFFNFLQTELVLEEEKLMFSHAFPPSLAEHADKLGIDKSAIELLEVYVVKKEDWTAYVANEYGLNTDAIDSLEAYVKGMSNNLSEDVPQEVVGIRRRHAIAEEVVEILPEGFTWFGGHTHKDYIVDGSKDRRIIIHGAGFNPRAKQGDDDYDFAKFVLYDTERPKNPTCGRVRYNRKQVDKETEEAGYAS